MVYDSGGKWFTYIIITANKEFYCGKTKNISKRVYEHIHESKPSWFGFKNRKSFNLYYIEGDYEKRIKTFGVKTFYSLIRGEWKQY